MSILIELDTIKSPDWFPYFSHIQPLKFNILKYLKTISQSSLFAEKKRILSLFQIDELNDIQDIKNILEQNGRCLEIKYRTAITYYNKFNLNFLIYF